MVLKMEKQREEYEQKALKAIQRAENEKAEAQSKMEYLQVRPQMQVKKASITNLKKKCRPNKKNYIHIKKPIYFVI